MENTNKKLLERDFDFLYSVWGFYTEKIKSYNYALYGEFLSDSVGIYFIYEFRDTIPQIQFTLLISNKLEVRPGLYTIREFYKNENFELKSFYLDEIILFKNGEDYKSYFQGVKTIEEAIKISKELIAEYAMDFVVGNVDSYIKMNNWFRIKIMNLF